jgi:hypothetical protein
VLNADMTPADIGAAQDQKAMPVAAMSRVPACGEGCKLEQPDRPRETAYGSQDQSSSDRSRNGTRVLFISNVNGSQPQQAAKPAASPRKSFRFRRR